MKIDHPKILTSLAGVGVFIMVITACQSPSRSLGNGSLATPSVLPLSGQAEPSPVGAAPSGKVPAVGDCLVFPTDNIWNVPIDQLPVDQNSQAYIESIGVDAHLHPDFGSGLYNGEPIGIPYVSVPPGQKSVPVSFDYADESDPGTYPIPSDALVEGGPDSDGDRHILIVDQGTCKLYELFYAFPEADGSWSAASGAIFDLNSNALRPQTWTSADGAGLPILPGLVRYEEVAAGVIDHALRFTAPRTRREYVWPARHFASDLTDNTDPPMGQRFRLRADFDASVFSPGVQVIVRALKTYGMILADNGSPWFLSGVPNDAWDNDVLSELKQISGSDFEAVDVSSLMVDPDSAQARVTTAPTNTGSTDEAGVGHITYSLNDGTVYRLQAQDGAQPENISSMLDRFSPRAPDSVLNISPDGQWMVFLTYRFSCADWACLAVLRADMSDAKLVMSGGEVVHTEGFGAIASGGNLIVYPANDGSHDMDLWAVTRDGEVWSSPVQLTRDSPFDYHDQPAISPDGNSVIFICQNQPIDSEAKTLCEVHTDGSGFHIVLVPEQGPSGQFLRGIHSPDYEPEGGLIFEADTGAEEIWRLAPGKSTPALVTVKFINDNSPCVLPDGRLVSLWLDRPGSSGAHELKVMQPDGSSYYIALPNIDVADIGLGCGG